MQTLPTLANNPQFLWALIALVLVTLGSIFRLARIKINPLQAGVTLGALTLFGFLFYLLMIHARQSAFTLNGSVPLLAGPTGWIISRAAHLKIYLVNHQDFLVAGGTLVLMLLALASLLRKKPAFFWMALTLVVGIQAEVRISQAQDNPAIRLYALALLSSFIGMIWLSHQRKKQTTKKKNQSRIWSILIAGLILINLGLGFYRLDQVPRFDQFEATNALVGVQLIEDSQPTRDMIWSYFARSYGADSSSSALFTVPAAFLMRIGGIHLVSYRASSVLWGILSVLLLYILARRLIGTGGALIAAILISISSWHLTIYRAGMFGSLSMAYTLLGLILLLEAIRQEKVILYALLGFFWSLYGFCYLPVKLVFPLLILVFVHRAIFYRGFLRHNWLGLLAFILVFAIFFITQAGNIGMVADTAYTSSKQGSIYPFIGSESRADLEIRWELIPGQLMDNLEVLYINLCSHRGSGSFTYPPKGGLINRTEFMLAVLGLGWVLANLKRTRGILLLGWLVPALAPFMLLVKDIGSPPRHIMLAIPLIAILAGAFLSRTGKAFWDLFPPRARLLPSSIQVLVGGSLLAALAIFGVARYFNSPEPDKTAVGRFVNTMITKGYRCSIHLHPQYRRLEPSRRIDFLSFGATGNLFRHHTNIRQYYDYHEVIPDPWRTYYPGPEKIQEAFDQAGKEDAPLALIVDSANQKKLEEVIGDGSDQPIGKIISLDGRVDGYYFLINPNSDLKIKDKKQN